MEEKVYFTNDAGVRLCGVLADPTGDKTKTIVLICHGYHSSKDRLSYTSFSSALYSSGVASFRFDFFGNGESDGKIEDLTLSEGVNEVIRAIDYLRSLGYTKIGVFGSSFGGTTSLIAAAKEPDLAFLALRCPIPSYEDRANEKLTKQELDDWKRLGYRPDYDEQINLKYSYYEDFKNNDGYAAAKQIQIPVCIVIGDQDEFVPIAQIRTIHPLFSQCELTVIAGANHNFTGVEHNKIMFDTIFAFISKHI